MSSATRIRWLTIEYRFGWVNASYVYGLEFLNAHQRRALGAITPWETYSKAIAVQDAY
jgi:alpha,alpha-trehalase